MKQVFLRIRTTEPGMLDISASGRNLAPTFFDQIFNWPTDWNALLDFQTGFAACLIWIQCNQICQIFATLAVFKMSLAII